MFKRIKTFLDKEVQVSASITRITKPIKKTAVALPLRNRKADVGESLDVVKVAIRLLVAVVILGAIGAFVIKIMRPGLEITSKFTTSQTSSQNQSIIDK